MPGINFEQKIDTIPDYKKLLAITRVDTIIGKELVLRFSVSENYTIFITSGSHENLLHSYGVDPETTLTEGYIFFDDAHEISRINFKTDNYQTNPAFKETPEKLALLKKAVEELLKEPQNKKYL